MNTQIAGFDWDRGNRKKCQGHGLSIREVEAVFERPIAVFPDVAHSDAEERFKAIGTTAEGRRLFIVFTLRNRDGQTYLRPISARPMHRKEVDYYEKIAPSVQNR